MAKDIILTVLSSQLLLWIVQFWITRHFQKKDKTTEKIEKLSDGMLAILRYRLFEEMSDSEPDKDKLPILSEIYDSYISLGGNGTVKNMYKAYLKKIN